MSPQEEALVAGLAARLAADGLDLVQPLNAAWYDAAVAPEFRLPAPGGRCERLVLAVASSRAFWSPFVARLRAEPGRLDRPDPIDAYVADVVHAAVEDLPVAHEVRFSFDPPPRRIAMQRLAHVSGLAPLTAAMLCVHPVYGPWIALRAAIVLDLPGPPGPAPEPVPRRARVASSASRRSRARRRRARRSSRVTRSRRAGSCGSRCATRARSDASTATRTT